MSKRKAVKIDHLGEMPSDLPGVFWRFERRHWSDGTSCLDIRKWGFQPTRKRSAPWYPTECTQIPWELADKFIYQLMVARSKGGAS